MKPYLNGCFAVLLLSLIACSGDEKTTTTESVAETEMLHQAETVEVVQSTTEMDESDVQASPQLVESAFDADEVKRAYADMPVKVLDISERSFDGGNALAVTFSIPLNPAEQHQDYLVVSQQGQGNIDGGWVLSESGKIAYFPNIEPATEYQVQVYRGLKAGNGERLASSETATIKTRNVRASYGFASEGNFLPLELHSGLPVVVVNTPEVNVDFFKVRPDRITNFLYRLGNDRESVSRYYANRSLKEGDLVYSGRFKFDAPRNKRREFNLPVQNIPALSEPGLYVAAMSLPGDFYENIRLSYFTVTDIGMHLRLYDDRIDAHLSSLQTAKPLGGVEVSLLNHKGNVLQSTQSTPEGLASLNNSRDSRAYVLARKGDSLSIVKMNSPALDLSDFDLGKRPYRPMELFIYGPRDLYRPGEKVDFSALLRDYDGRLGKTPVLEAKLYRPDGQVAKSLRLQPEKLGYYSAQYTLASNAKTGEWRLQVRNIGGQAVDYRFKVEEFMPERMKLTFNPGQEGRFYSPTEPLKVKVLGEYLYGAPAAGNRFESRILLSPQREPLDSLKGYQFGNINETLKQNFTLADVKLNDSGEYTIDIENRWKQIKSPLQVSLLGSLFETGGRPVTRRHNTTIWPSKTMIGIRPGFGEKNPPANSRVSFDIVRADSKGKLLAADDLEVTLVREDRRYFWEYNDHQGWHYEWTDREYPEYSTSISVKQGEPAKFEVNVEYGSYRLEVRDPQTKLLSSVRFYAGRDWYYWWRHNQSGEQASRPDKVSLAFNQKAYKEGDVAELSIVPPHDGEALVMVESDVPLFTQRISVPKSGTIIKIPIESDWNRHDLYISVVHLQKADGLAKVTPKRAFGLIHLPLDRESRELHVSFDVADKITPSQTYKAKVKVDGLGGKQAQITLAAVDVGVLSITDFKTPEPHKFFFEQRRYQVDSRDMYQKLIELNDNPLAAQRFGGDAQLSRGGKNAQAEVQIVSLFSGAVKLDEHGEATVDLEIPDFNGRLRLMAVAYSADSYGHGEKEMTVAAPLVTQIAMPRFMAMGDQSTLALDIHNMSDEAQSLKVDLKVSSPLTHDKGIEELRLAKGEKTTLLYPVTAAYEMGRSQVDLSITGMDNYTVERSWGLQVRAAHPARTFTRQAIVKPQQSFVLESEALKTFIPESVEAVLTLNNMVDLNLRDQMKNLLRYPYGCLEQSTSSTYPWLFATDENLRKMDLKNRTGKSRLKSIEHGMARIREKMLNNGGYGLWSNTSNEQQWLTAYVADFLTDAKALGVDVDRDMYDKTMRRLQDYLRKRNGTYSNRWSEYAGHYDFAYRTYAGYVLSRHNQASLSNLRELAKNNASNTRSFLPLIHLALAVKNQGDKALSEDLFQRAFATERGNGYYADYGSDIRDMALAIHLLLRHQVYQDKAKIMAVELADKLSQRRYLSTQERNALFLAGLALETRFSSEWLADVKLAGAVQQLRAAGSKASKYTGEELQQGLSLMNKGEGDLYVHLDYLGYSETKPAPERGENLNIERLYFDTKGRRLDVSNLKVGDLVLVGLTVDTRWRAPDVLVVDLLPAGLELENQNLNHAIKLDEIEFDGKKVSYWVERTQVVHREFRDDRYVAALDAAYGSRSYLFYLARAVTPGNYSVPAPLVEDMYRPEDRAIGHTIDRMHISNL